MQKTVHDFAYAHRHQIASKVDPQWSRVGLGKDTFLSPQYWSLHRIALDVKHRFHRIQWVVLARVCAEGSRHSVTNQDRKLGRDVFPSGND